MLKGYPFGNGVVAMEEKTGYEIDENVYSSQVREILVDEDALTIEEDGFMLGYEKACSSAREFP